MSNSKTTPRDNHKNTVKQRKVRAAVLAIYREPPERPAFGVWVNKYGQIIDGDEGQKALFGGVAHCFLPLAPENYCHATALFYDLSQGKRTHATALLNGITATGDKVMFQVRAELVAYTDDDAWIAIHGWEVPSLNRLQAGKLL